MARTPSLAQTRGPNKISASPAATTWPAVNASTMISEEHAPAAMPTDPILPYAASEAILQACPSILPLLAEPDLQNFSRCSKDVRTARFKHARALTLRACPEEGEAEVEAGKELVAQVVQDIEFAVFAVGPPAFELHLACSSQLPAQVLNACSPAARSRLTSVWLEGMDLDQLVPSVLLDACPQLKHLGLQDCKLSLAPGSPHTALAASTGQHPNLQQLSLSSFRPTYEDQSEDCVYLTAMLQAELARLPNLTHVSLTVDIASKELLLPSLRPMATHLTRLHCSFHGGNTQCSYLGFHHQELHITNRLSIWGSMLGHLKQLALTNTGYIRAPDLQVLLRIHTITHLTVDGFYLRPNESFIDTPCTWETLVYATQPGYGLHLPSLGRLPLHSLKQPLQVQRAAPQSGWSVASVMPRRLSPYSTTGLLLRVGKPGHNGSVVRQDALDLLIQELQNAAANLARCGGIQWGADIDCLHWSDDEGLKPDDSAELLIAALPLLQGATAVTRLELNRCHVTASLAAALRASMGGHLVTVAMHVGEVQPGVACS